jgi:hypothetical protein
MEIGEVLSMKSAKLRDSLYSPTSLKGGIPRLRMAEE